MNTCHSSPIHLLDADQLAILVRIVVEESGDKLIRAQFDDAMLMLFENIAGLEHLTRKTSDRYLKTLWSMYPSSRN